MCEGGDAPEGCVSASAALGMRCLAWRLPLRRGPMGWGDAELVLVVMLLLGVGSLLGLPGSGGIK